MKYYHLFIIISLVIVLPLSAAGETTHKRTKAGNDLYAEKKFDQALTKYQDALLSDPENKRIQFNVANTLYQKKKFEEALKEYQNVIGAKELPLEGQTYYNLGNTLYRLGKLPESILSYQQALKIDPDDVDAKYNLEYVRRKLKQNSEKQQQESQPQQKQEEQPQQKTQEEEEKEGDQEKQKPQDQQSGQESAADQKKLSKEEAERILDALKNDEKDPQKKRKMQVSGKTRYKKDW